MARLVFDLETNGLLDELDRVHCLAIGDMDTGEITGYADQPGHPPIREGLQRLTAADVVYAHNGVGFDRPALAKVYPHLRLPELRDTMVMARVIWPELAPRDLKTKDFPRQHAGSHSLAAWGHRLGEHKGDYTGGWDRFSEEMLAYNLQDVRVTMALLRRIEKEDWPESSFQLEHAFAQAIFLQERRGFGFDVAAGQHLYADLVARRVRIETELAQVFPPWVVPGPEKVAQRNMTLAITDELGVKAKRKIATGETYRNHTVVHFNPGSRHHIADRLMTLRGWKPKRFTDSGQPMVDEGVLGGLPYPEAKLLAEYLTIQKRIGQLAEGNQAWLKLERNGRIYGRVNTNGALTGRCTHSKPNVAQVPSEPEYRRLFVPTSGYTLVGVDAKGLELRCLAHYVAHWDKGKYAEVVTTGDPHSYMAQAVGLPRSEAKVFTYAFMYGAGDQKLGSIAQPTASPTRQRALGAELRARVSAGFTGLGKLVNLVQHRTSSPGYLVGLDGRRLKPRGKNSALNTLLQSAGAIIMKQALVLLVDRLEQRGWEHGREFALVGNIH
ncbi:MAG: ribonuclease H-like domain-containing protein, partial [Armatimonadetes bacterium]|nr:ribonuclease H-like domain-containing protein [Armatimonadota bacterium]